MPAQPNQLHRDRALEQISVMFKNSAYVADMVFPRVPVQRESDFYYVYSQDVLTVPETQRAMGSPSNQKTWNVSTSTYVLSEHALHDYIPDRLKDNADKPLDPMKDAVEILTDSLLSRREKDLAATLQTVANFTNVLSLTSTLCWNQNTTLSNPITMIDSLSSAVVQNSGVVPNKIIINDAMFRAAKEHISVVDRQKYVSNESVTEDILARLFGLEKVLVARAIENTAKEGITPSMQFIWTDVAALIYCPMTPGLKTPSAGYTFWKDGIDAPFKVEMWREDIRTADAVQVSGMWQHKAVATNCLYLINNVLA